MSEIKCCPFCGGKITLDEDEFYMFCCDTCGAGITFAKELDDGTACDCTKEESIDKWNTRKPMEKIKEKIEIRKMIASEKNECDVELDSYVSGAFDETIEIVEKGGIE